MNIKIRDIEQLLLVATCPRSGSSMFCNIMESFGAFGGDTMGVVPANEKGIFENQGLNVLAMKPIFESLGIRNPTGLLTVHKLGGAPKELFKHFAEDITYGLNRQGYKGGVAYYKSGIYTFLFDRINEIFPNAIWVLPCRDKDGIFKSTQRIRPMQPQQSILDDIDAYMEMYDHIDKVGGDRVFRVDSDAIVQGDYSTLKPVVEHLGLVWDEAAVKKIVDKKAWNQTDEVKTTSTATTTRNRRLRAGN